MQKKILIVVGVLSAVVAGLLVFSSGGDVSRPGPDLNKWKAGGHYFKFRGRRIFYRDSDANSKKENRPVLLLVHGFPTSSWDWHRVEKGLSARYRVIAPDMIGYGYSDKPAGFKYSTAAQADLHEALLATLGIKHVSILSYSFGASVVQELLARGREGRAGPQIAAAIFLNGGLFPETNRPKAVQKLLMSPLGPLVVRFMSRSTLDKNMRSIFGPRTQPSHRLIEDYWYLLNRADGRRRIPSLIQYLRDRDTHAARWRGALTGTRARLLLIVGMTDTISGPDMAAQYRRVVPRPRVVEFSDIGHYPQLEAPEKTAGLVLDFLKGASRGD